MVAKRRSKEIHPAMWFLTAFSLVFLILMTAGIH
jgi:hypothetical protein